MQVHLLVLDRAPQPLDEHVVSPAALAVHRDADAVAHQQAGEGRACKLTALIGVEDLGRAITGDRLLDGIGAELGVHRYRQPPGQHPAAVPIDHRGQVDEAPGHRDVADVHGPDLVGPRDGQRAQQVRVDRAPGCLPAGVGLPVERRDRHAPHQRGHVLAAHRDAFAAQQIAQQIAQHARSGKRQFQVQLVDAAHQLEVIIAHRLGPVVRAAAADTHEFGLPLDWQRMTSLDHRPTLSRPALLSAPDKKSISSACWPILACNPFKSTAGSAADASPPNTSAARLRS